MNGDGKPFLINLFSFLLAIAFLHAGCKTQSRTLSSPKKSGTLNSECEEAKRVAKEITDFSLTISFREAFRQVKEKAKHDPLHEHIISFGKDSTNEIILSAVATGSRSSGLVPTVSNAFADLHNHPNNTPPSSGDLYGLLRKNSGDYRHVMRFILTAGGTLYAFVVTDTAAVRRFLNRYPPQQTLGYSPLFPDALLDEYREMIQRYGASEEMAMAYLLEKYEVGAALIKQSSDGSFKILRTKLSINKGEKVFTSADCL